MITLWQEFSVIVLYLGSSLVTGVLGENIELQGKDSHERKAIPIHKSHPLPDGDSKTTEVVFTTFTDLTTERSSKLTTLTSETFTTQWNLTTTSNRPTPNASEPTTPPTYHPITAPPVNDTCQNLLEHYGNLSSAFTNCAIIHAKPFLFCENCVKEYVATLDAYKKITEDEGVSFNFY